MKITIIALGWLGIKLYKYWEGQSLKVSGSYFRKPKGLVDFYFDIGKKEIPREIEGSDVIFFNLTPSGIGSIENFKNLLSKVADKKFIFISSTSVYGAQGTVSELTGPCPDSDSGKFLLECEQLINIFCKNHLIIRPAGLYGEDRHPGKSLSGKENILNPDHPVNLVGSDDLIWLIAKAVKQDKIKLLNAVNSHHPSKKEYYEAYCQKNGLIIPKFKRESEPHFKLVKTIYEDFQISSMLP